MIGEPSSITAANIPLPSPSLSDIVSAFSNTGNRSLRKEKSHFSILIPKIDPKSKFTPKNHPKIKRCGFCNPHLEIPMVCLFPAKRKKLHGRFRTALKSEMFCDGAKDVFGDNRFTVLLDAVNRDVRPLKILCEHADHILEVIFIARQAVEAHM